MREFSDFAEFAAHFAEAVAASEIAAHKALDKASAIIQKDAKRRLGHYQEAVGPFQDWAELADSTQEQRERMGYTPNDPLLRSGELRESIVREIHEGEAVIGSKKDEAAYMEFGTRTIPPRAFMGPAAYANKEKIQELIGTAMVKGLIEGHAIHESLGYDMSSD